MENSKYSNEEIALRAILDRKKGFVCNEFEKVCPTETSLRRVVKEMHNIFDGIEEELKRTFKI